MRIAFWHRGVWQSTDYSRLWSAAVVSAFGSAITQLAVPLLAATTLHATPAQMGLLVASDSLPILVLGLLAGTWLDRRTKRPVMIVADLVRGALLLALPMAWVLGVLRVELLIAIAFLVGCLSVFFDIASQSLLPMILRDERLAEGNARLFTGWSIAEIAGPGVAGWCRPSLRRLPPWWRPFPTSFPPPCSFGCGPPSRPCGLAKGRRGHTSCVNC